MNNSIDIILPKLCYSLSLYKDINKLINYLSCDYGKCMYYINIAKLKYLIDDDFNLTNLGKEYAKMHIEQLIKGNV